MSRCAFIFAGQGSQVKGFPLLNQLCEQRGAAWHVLREADDMFRTRFDCSLLAVMRENPTLGSLCGAKVHHASGLLHNTVFAQPAILAYQQATLRDMFEKCPEAERRFRGQGSGGSNGNVKNKNNNNNETTTTTTKLPPTIVAGHSLGEFSALTAAGIFTPAAAAELVARRGLAMERALHALGLPPRASDGPPSHFVMVAIDPQRALLTEATLLALIELVSRAVVPTRPHALLELVNDNVHGRQLVVAADRYTASVLGKCVDPQWRSGCAENGIKRYEDVVAAAVFDADADERIGVTTDPNAPPPAAFVPGSVTLAKTVFLGHPRELTQDNGLTQPEDRLTRLSHIGAGRSGLKKRSYFVQLPVEVPFHSSALRHAFDEFHETVTAAVPALDVVRARLCGGGADADANHAAGGNFCWIPNVTGCAFDAAPDSAFRKALLETFTCMNVGEQTHEGKFVPTSWRSLAAAAATGDARDLLIATLTAQLSHVVCWSSTMDEMMMLNPVGPADGQSGNDGDSARRVGTVIEFAPHTSVLTDMLKRRLEPHSVLEDGKAAATPAVPPPSYAAFTLPRDIDKVAKHFAAAPASM